VADELRDDHIAIVGMACRFPGANTPGEYWNNLATGVESISWLSEAELTRSGVPPGESRHPHYVNAAFLIDDMEGFDARFFGYTPREAAVRDPQGRWFLEACHAAVEDSGHDVTRIDGSVGVFGGMANNLYGERNVKLNAATSAAVGAMAIDVSNSPDYLATTVSYRLGFRGPSVSVQTACSTALVAVHLASQSLRAGECDFALAGGVEVELPYRAGYLWVEGGIYSRTGHIRPFDADACGTQFGTGAGVVALKRLGDAYADGDHIYAVIRGSAVNNDGGDRAGFTAPGVEGQAQLIIEALAVAEAHPDSIGFVEAHATGTLVGDPIEVAGLTRAFRAAGATAVQACPIGAVKANVGHLGPASGMAGLIKVCLALQHGAIPPNINFTVPNPNLNLDASPFYVITELTPWPSGGPPRRAGVSSFGIGGTNAHLVIEGPPASHQPAGPRPLSRRWHTLPVSAKTASAADSAVRRLGAALAGDGLAYELSDVAYTLQVGRAALPHRRAVTAESAVDAAHVLEGGSPGRLLQAAPSGRSSIAMMFPGQGTQYAGMGRGLYDTEPSYRTALGECADLLTPHLGLDIRELLLPAAADEEAAQARLRETRFSQPALFTVEYALTRLLRTAGLLPSCMIGHSIGEYVAAHLAGVFTLADALAIVAARGRLMQEMAPGVMMAAAAPAYVIRNLLPIEVDIAAVNGPNATVIAGTRQDIAQARVILAGSQIAAIELQTSHAFHTRLMEPCLSAFTAVVARFPRFRPRLPFISNVTGTWISDDDATDPGYWARHLRSTVQFADGIAALTARDDLLLLEVGPGDALSRLARRCAGGAVPVVPTMRQPERTADDDSVLAEALAALWVNGIDIDWAAWSGTRRRVPLPTYPFERQRYWVSPDVRPAAADTEPDDAAGGPLPADRCSFAPLWREAPLATAAGTAGARFLVFSSGHPVLAAFTGALADAGSTVTVVSPGPAFARTSRHSFTIRPASTTDLEQLFEALPGEPPTDIVHAFTVGDPASDPIEPGTISAALNDGFYSLLHLGQRLASGSGQPTRVHVISSNMQEISGTEPLEPAKALLIGPVMLMKREIAHVIARSIDIELPSALPAATVAGQLLAEVAAGTPHVQAGWRGRKRWRLDYQSVPMATAPPAKACGGTYLITGGLGGIGLAVAEDIANGAPSTIVLIGRSAFPPREEWPALIAAADTAESLRTKLTRLRAIEERGSTVVIAQCDVSNETALAETVTTIRRRYGRIHGAFHSAGVAGGAMMAVRADADAADVIAPKLAGTLALYRVLGHEVEFLALFSSLAAATGVFGLVDYCAANNFLDAFARWATQRDRPVYSIGWAQWSEFGMSADADTSAPQAFRQLQMGSHSEPAVHPLLDRRIRAPGTTAVFSTLLEPGKHWITAEHRLDGCDVLVGTALLEMVDGAYREAIGGTAEILDVIFLGPVGVASPTEVRIEMHPCDGGHDVVVTAAAISDDAPVWTERMRCRVRPADTCVVPKHDLGAISARCSRLSVSEEQLRATGNLIEHGAHWTHNVKSTAVGDQEDLSLVEISDCYSPESGQYRLHPALLDSAVTEAYYAGARRARGDSYLPLGYSRIRVHEPLPPRFWVHIRHRCAPGADVDTMDLVLMHDDGQEIAQISGYTERRVDPAGIRAVVSGELPGTAASAPAPHLHHADEIGISAELGIDVLHRILYWRPAPHLIVCPEGIHRSLRRVHSLTLDAVQRELGEAYLAGMPASQERLVETPYAAPETDLERALTGLWGGTLGVAQIGLDDNFFELGGNSLVAVQLAARVRDGLSVELPIVVLFDHPTVRMLATYLADRQPTAAGATEPIGAMP
jgi:acyl transferase domain-containing protein/acyl carrier protein